MDNLITIIITSFTTALITTYINFKFSRGKEKQDANNAVVSSMVKITETLNYLWHQEFRNTKRPDFPKDFLQEFRQAQKEYLNRYDMNTAIIDVQIEKSYKKLLHLLDNIDEQISYYCDDSKHDIMRGISIYLSMYEHLVKYAKTQLKKNSIQRFKDSIFLFLRKHSKKQKQRNKNKFLRYLC
jgi:RecG-like helicase